MLHSRLVSAFVKAGCKVTPIIPWNAKEGDPIRRWMATNPKTGQSVEWHTQDGFVPAKDGNPAYWSNEKQTTGYVTARHPDTDVMTDLFMDSYFSTIRSAVSAICG